MSALYTSIQYAIVLKLISLCLTSGSISFVVFIPTESGCPPGVPLSPYLSNILLDFLAKELGTRCHKHVSYADDCTIYVHSLKAGNHVKASITHFIISKLKLQVNASKCAVYQVSTIPFLGFKILTIHPKSGLDAIKILLSSARVNKLKDLVGTITSTSLGISIQRMVHHLSTYLMHWSDYYKKISPPTVLKHLDSWISRSIRCYHLKQWQPHSVRYQGLLNLGVLSHTAKSISYSSNGIWRLMLSKLIHKSIHNTYLEKMGLTSLLKQLTNRTAVYGSVCAVV